MLEAEILWLKESQKALVKEKDFELWQRQFGIFIDEEGLYRCKGRLGKADVPIATKHPILLTKQHCLTYLIVKDAHEHVIHNGVKEMLTEVRSKFWVVKGRQFVRQVIYQCVCCRKFDGTPYCARPLPPLPEF